MHDYVWVMCCGMRVLILMIVYSNVGVNMCEKHGSECYLTLQLHWYRLNVWWYIFGYDLTLF